MSNNDLPKFPVDSFCFYMQNRIGAKASEIENIKKSLSLHVEKYFNELICFFVDTKDFCEPEKTIKVDFLKYLIKVFRLFGLGLIPLEVYNCLSLSVVSKIFIVKIFPFELYTWDKLYQVFSLHENINEKSLTYAICRDHAKKINELLLMKNQCDSEMVKLLDLLNLSKKV